MLFDYKGRKPLTIDLSMDRSTYVEAQDLQETIDTNGRNIRQIEFIAPRLGGSSFGQFKITWKNRVYETITHVS